MESDPPHGLRGTTLTPPGPGSVHVWGFAVTSPDLAAGALNLLSEEERERASRFVAESARIEYVLARSALRDVLGRYLGCDPRAISFETDARGKPALGSRQIAPPTPFAFNVSHSGGRALIAVAGSSSVGVDIERLADARDAAGIIGRFFTDPERAAYHAAAAEERRRRFLEMWVRKEAVAKAIGRGLALDFSTFSVVGDDGVYDRTVDAGQPVSVAAVEVDAGWVAAVAIPGTDAIGAIRVC